MRIAVVDDENIFRMQFKMIMDKLAQEKELALEIEEFATGTDFIAALEDRRFDVVFMDIYMPDMDGVTTARQLRQKTERIFLIFMTASDEHYPDAFSLHAFDYVTKPFTQSRLEKVLDEILDHTPQDEAFVKVSTVAADQKIYLKDIAAVRTDGHYLDIDTGHQNLIRVRLTASQFLEMTGNDRRFLNINRGLIVNMEHVSGLTDQGAMMDNGTTLPVAVRKQADVLQQFNDFKFSRK